MQSQENYTKKLYEASIRGDVTTLMILLHRDPLILDRISLFSFTETPLHILSMIGHVDFTTALLNQKPKLAAELNSQGQSPLHLASAEGNSEIVKALLGINTNVCSVPDQYGRIPLHLAAMRGRVEVIQRLISACPESAQAKLHGGETVLHLCVKYNHLEALKMLVTLLGNDCEFLNSVDNDGNTILHFAVMMKQIQTIKYLVSIPEVKVEADALSAIFKNYESDQNSNKLGSGGEWLEKTRGNLMVVATVIAAMAFQAAVNPPGGVWETDNTECTQGIKTCKAGTSILAYTNKTRHHQFFFKNIISFCASLTTIILLISGIPLKRKVYIWILLMVMCITLFFTAATYVVTVAAIKEPGDEAVDHFIAAYTWFWVVLLIVVAAFYSVKFLFRLMKKMFGGVILGMGLSFRIVKNMFRVLIGSLVVEQPGSYV